jgi:hypothetical protein
MMDSGPDDIRADAPDALPGGSRRPPVAAIVAVAGIALALGAAGALLLSTAPRRAAPPGASGSVPSAIAEASPSADGSGLASSAPRPSATSGPPLVSSLNGRRLAASGSIAVVGADGSLGIVDATGHSLTLANDGDATYGFPAWSHDGRRIAAVRYGSADVAILVFDAQGAALGRATAPVPIFRSFNVGPFYLFWTPDDRRISFLAGEENRLTLRIAPADGSAPLDGSGPGAIIKDGSPLYYDFVQNDMLLVHVGSGNTAFLGEVGLDGAAPAAELIRPGNFRSPVVSLDHHYIAFVRQKSNGTGEIVVAAEDGSGEHVMPVFAPAAVEFDPIDDIVASIGPIRPSTNPPDIPLGPLRLIDARSGGVRTLLEGLNVAFWWSPDGKTIAALRVGTATAPSPSGGASAPASSASPGGSPASSAEPELNEIRLVFVDVASGRVRSQPLVAPGRVFIDQFLNYFDQYSLSHRLWAPDSSSIVFPVDGPNRTTRLEVFFPDGEAPIHITAEIGFWSP